MRKLSILATTALFTALSSQGAIAATAVSAAYPESIVDAIQDMGYKAELTTDSYGDPMIRSASDGVNSRSISIIAIKTSIALICISSSALISRMG